MSKDPKVAERFSKTATRDLLNPATKRRISAKHKFGWFITKKNPLSTKSFYRSSYELATLHLLEEDENILFVKPEPIAIEYVFNKRDKKYIPDFEITYSGGEKTIIEVKPKDLLGHPLNMAKFKAAQHYCETNGIKFEIWDESKITSEALRAAEDEHTFIEKKQLSCIRCKQNISYSPSRPRKYCSHRCYILNKKKIAGMIDERVCSMCKTKFLPKYSCQKTCSKDCRIKLGVMNRTRHAAHHREFIS